MDEVIEQFSDTLTSLDPENERSNHEGLYKNWGRLGNQEERRKEILEVQKSNRNNKLDRSRGILELVNEIEENDIFHSDRRAYYRPSIYVAGFNRARNYNNVLMHSEWMIEKPSDFAENWLMVPCPKGVRMLVVATAGTTKCFTKHGIFRFEKRTALPGGSGADRKRSSCCILDCMYIEKINTMFILDLLAWNLQPMTDGETEFRHFWLQSQLSEYPKLRTISKTNQMIFKILPKIPCDTDSINAAMQKCPFFEHDMLALDGLLFYHKRAHYTAGETPLVGWLYPYMLPEVIDQNISINQAYELLKPQGYVNQADFIQKFTEKANRRTKNRRSSDRRMDTAEIGNETNGGGQATAQGDNSTEPSEDNMQATNIETENSNEELQMESEVKVTQEEELVDQAEENNALGVE